MGTILDKLIKIELFTDYVWPWCYLSTVRVEKLKKSHNVKVKLVHFPLHPDTPIEGQSLKQMFGPGKDIDEMNRKMKALMEKDAFCGYPDHNKPFKIYTNASDYLIGAGIIQDSKSVAYYLQKLSKT